MLSITKFIDSVVDRQALTLVEDAKTPWGMTINGLSFQQEAILSHGGHQYAGDYDGDRPKLFADDDSNLFMIFRQPKNLKDFNEFEGSGLKGLFFSRGRLVIAGATAASKWSDWQILHAETGPFFNEMLGDKNRWYKEGVLSVLVQDSPPGKPGTPTALRILDFKVGQ